MPRKSKAERIGILTSGGDCPGLNAAIRAIAKTAIGVHGMKVVGILEGFRGLVKDKTIRIDEQVVSGILTHGGTILGTSRDKPHRMPVGGKLVDMMDKAVATVRRNRLDCLVCLGGGGTQKVALRLAKAGVRVVTLPKTIDNDVAGTDISFGFDTAMNIATEAIDRLHTTATSHHRIIVCEIMGHRAGWLTLGAGIAGGADVILIPEIPYDLDVVADYLRARRKKGKRFSIVAVAEGARSREEIKAEKRAAERRAESASADKSSAGAKKAATKKGGNARPEDLWKDETRDGLPLVVKQVDHEIMAYHVVQEPMSSRIARQVQELTGTEARVTTLGHVQRGGVPTPFDRMLCTLLGTKAADLIAQGVYGVMVAYRGESCLPVPLEKVAGFRKSVPEDHPMVQSARGVGTCFGDR